VPTLRCSRSDHEAFPPRRSGPAGHGLGPPAVLRGQRHRRPARRDPPDVSGPYQVIVGGTTGCEGESGWINDWATGPLTISGTGGALSFDFGTGTVFDGSIDSLGRYQFSGTIDFNNAVLDVSNEGSFALDPDYDGERWLMDGDFSVVVDDDEFTTNNCTITGPVKATELVGI